MTIVINRQFFHLKLASSSDNIWEVIIQPGSVAEQARRFQVSADYQLLLPKFSNGEQPVVFSFSGDLGLMLEEKGKTRGNMG